MFSGRGLVPKQAPAQMAMQSNSLFKNKHLPGLGVYFGTDASDRPRGADPSVFSWAVVAVRVTTYSVHSPENGAYELLGTMTGTLQIGATVNDGEQFATTPVRSSSESKVAINRCLKANIQHTLPQVHLPSAERAAALVDQRSSRCGPALPKVTGELVDVGHQPRGGYGMQPQER